MLLKKISSVKCDDISLFYICLPIARDKLLREEFNLQWRVVSFGFNAWYAKIVSLTHLVTLSFPTRFWLLSKKHFGQYFCSSMFSNFFTSDNNQTNCKFPTRFECFIQVFGTFQSKSNEEPRFGHVTGRGQLIGGLSTNGWRGIKNDWLKLQ